MNLWLALDNCLSVTQLVRALHRNRRAAGSIPARGPISQLLLVRSKKFIKIPLEISVEKSLHAWKPFRNRAFFNYITTGAFTPVGPLLAPAVKHDFQMNWALLIISKRLTLLKICLLSHILSHSRH